MSAHDLRRLLPFAQRAVGDAIAEHASAGGHIARGMASEGFDGGYAAALRDVDAVLHGFPPGDERRRWKRAAALAAEARRKVANPIPTEPQP